MHWVLLLGDAPGSRTYRSQKLSPPLKLGMKVMRPEELLRVDKRGEEKNVCGSEYSQHVAFSRPVPQTGTAVRTRCLQPLSSFQAVPEIVTSWN